MTRAKRPPLGLLFLLVALLAVALPLGLTGVWLLRDAGRAGEALLRARMDTGLSNLAWETNQRWLGLRARVLDLAEDPALQQALSAHLSEEGRLAASAEPAAGLEAGLVAAHPALGGILHLATIRDPSGLTLARLSWASGVAGAHLPVEVEVRDRASGTLLGRLELQVAAQALLPERGGWAARSGGVVGVLDAHTGAPVLGGPFDPGLLVRERFVYDGEEWITRRQPLSALPLVLVLASPLQPYTLPFQEAARRGVLVILAMGMTGFAAAAFLTVRITRSLDELAAAAGAIAGGELEPSVRVEGPEEVARAAEAFNAMAGALRDTLDTLARKEALAAVGEIAAALAHELRTPLTAIRLDLQQVDEVSDDDPRRTALMERMLLSVRDLDRTVEGTLRVAGSGRARLRPVSLGEIVDRAAAVSRPVFEDCDVRLVVPSGEPLSTIRGDAPALEHLLVNLLVNAAEAMDEGGQAEVQVRSEEGWAVISVLDNGPGVPDEVQGRAGEPLLSTKVGGTGLGLAIALRIVEAHGGHLTLENRPEGGARAEVRLPAP